MEDNRSAEGFGKRILESFVRSRIFWGAIRLAYRAVPRKTFRAFEAAISRSRGIRPSPDLCGAVQLRSREGVRNVICRADAGTAYATVALTDESVRTGDRFVRIGKRSVRAFRSQFHRSVSILGVFRELRLRSVFSERNGEAGMGSFFARGGSSRGSTVNEGAVVSGVLHESGRRSVGRSGRKIPGKICRTVFDSRHLGETANPFSVLQIRSSYDEKRRIGARESLRSEPNETITQGNPEFFRIKPEFRVIGIADGIVRSRLGTRASYERFGFSIENDERSSKGVLRVMVDETPCRNGRRGRFRRDCRINGADVRLHGRNLRVMPIFGKREKPYRGKNGQYRYNDNKLGEGESREFRFSCGPKRFEKAHSANFNR